MEESTPTQVSAPKSIPLTPAAFEPSNQTALYWLGSAGFFINGRGSLLLIDPHITMMAPGRIEGGWRLLIDLPIEAAAIPRLDAVLYTHSDGDHLARRSAQALLPTGARYFGPPPALKVLRDLGVPEERLQAVAYGEQFQVGAVAVTPTPADHPHQLRDPARLGPPFGPGDCCGYLLATADGSIWYPGDTRLMPEHLQMRGVDVLLTDVSRDEWHLGVESSARLANAVGAPHLIAYHYGTYDAPRGTAFNGDPDEVASKVHDAERRFHRLAPGEQFVVRRAAPNAR